MQSPIADASGRDQRALGALLLESDAGTVGHALGDEWTGCVVDTLLEAQRAAEAGGEKSSYFPMVEHNMQPLEPKARYQQSELFKHLLRNFT